MAKDKHRRSSDVPTEKETELHEIARARLGLQDRQDRMGASAPTDEGQRTRRSSGPTKKS